MKTNELAGDAPQEGTEREEWTVRRVKGGYILRMGNGAIPEVLTAEALIAELQDRLGAAPSGEPDGDAHRTVVRAVKAHTGCTHDQAMAALGEIAGMFSQVHMAAYSKGFNAGAAPAERRDRDDLRHLREMAERQKENGYTSMMVRVDDLLGALATAPREQEPDEEVVAAARRKRDIDRRGELLAREQEPVPRWKRRTVFGCPHCDAEFDTPRWCRLHIIKYHEEPPARCLCGHAWHNAACEFCDCVVALQEVRPECRHGFKWPDCLNCHRPLYRTVPGEEHIPNNGSAARKRNESTPPKARANVDKAAARAPKMILRCGRCERKIPGDFVFNPCSYCPKV